MKPSSDPLSILCDTVIPERLGWDHGWSQISNPVRLPGLKLIEKSVIFCPEELWQTLQTSP
jgi:hypothetical protein